MSKVKQAIETALENINSANRNTYGAKLYTFDQVAMILQDLYETACETGSELGASITREQIDDLIARIETRIDVNIENISDSDIVDEDSLEVNICGTRASIECIDIDKSNIIDGAQYGIDDEITGWAEKHGIYTEN